MPLVSFYKQATVILDPNLIVSSHTTFKCHSSWVDQLTLELPSSSCGAEQALKNTGVLEPLDNRNLQYDFRLLLTLCSVWALRVRDLGPITNLAAVLSQVPHRMIKDPKEQTPLHVDIREKNTPGTSQRRKGQFKASDFDFIESWYNFCPSRPGELLTPSPTLKYAHSEINLLDVDTGPRWYHI